MFFFFKFYNPNYANLTKVSRSRSLSFSPYEVIIIPDKIKKLNQAEFYGKARYRWGGTAWVRESKRGVG